MGRESTRRRDHGALLRLDHHAGCLGEDEGWGVLGGEDVREPCSWRDRGGRAEGSFLSSRPSQR